MPLSTREVPQVDPTPIFEAFRGNHSTELLAAAVGHFDLFGVLAAAGPLSFEDLRGKLGLSDRAGNVLFTAMRAMKLLTRQVDGRLDLTPLSREHLTPGGQFEVSDYIGLAAKSPGVLEMVERLKSDRPAGAKDKGAAFIYREGIESAMESEASARHLTLALAGRAKNVAPVLAQRLTIEGARKILDVGGGTGIYSIALLQRHESLRAVVFDRAEVLKVAGEMRDAYRVGDRLELVAGDMFADPLPGGCDLVLLSNILHDWDVPECRKLVKRCAAALAPGGRLLIHDVFLDDDRGGPLPLALYSAALFGLTEGRAYSAEEYRGWMRDVGLDVGEVIPTLIHCGVLPARKR